MLLLVSLQALAAAPGAPGVGVPLYALQHRCEDDRFPALAGPWAVGCSDEGGPVDVALSLVSGRLLRLPTPLTSPGVAPGWLYAPGRGGGLFRLTEDGVVAADDIATVHQAPVAPPATDGLHVAVLSDHQVQAFDVHERARSLFDASPAGWYPPALAWPRVAWVQQGDGEDVVWLDAQQGGDPAPLAVGPGDQRHVVSDGRRFAWVEPDAIVVLDPVSGERQRIAARTGFSAPPSLWQGVVCWERRDTGDVDILCSDGVQVEGPGHQRWPSRWGGWLLYRQDGLPMLFTAE